MPESVPQIDCLTAIRQLWDYLDEELSEERMSVVRRHLERCQRCLPHTDFSRRFLEALRATREAQVMPPELRRRVMECLSEAGYTET